MSKQMQHQLEMVNETATLYVSGALGAGDVGTLIQTCRAMPSRVRTLRLDLHGLGQLSAEATDAVRALLTHWRENRHGEFRLSTSHLLATLRDVAVMPIAASSGRYRPDVNEALVATYL